MIKNENIIDGKENLLQSAMLQTLNLRLSCLLDNVKGLDKENGLKRIGKNETGLISLSPF